ncbi:MAG: TIGR01906 family membrane protein [Clostridia bacterium]|nr:TIGR01906 family membrane protein [Clostridia bacterium]
MKNVLKKGLLTLVSMFICVGLVFSMALSCVYNKAHMTNAFQTYAQETREDILVADYEVIAGEIVRYLSTGKQEDIPMLREQVLFSEKENLHLADCSSITRGMGYVRFASIALVLVLFMMVMGRKDPEVRKKRVDELFQCFALGTFLLALVTIALAVWGLKDFESLFLTFHHVAFSNDLWILNPETDLLIQMMPYEFFVDYMGYIVKNAAPALILIFAAPIVWAIMSLKAGKAGKA